MRADESQPCPEQLSPLRDGRWQGSDDTYLRVQILGYHSWLCYLITQGDLHFLGVADRSLVCKGDHTVILPIRSKV